MIDTDSGLSHPWLRVKRTVRAMFASAGARRPPGTFEEAVDRLADRLSLDESQRLASMTESDLTEPHFTFGMWIRNAWLWTNLALVASVARTTQTTRPVC